MLAPGAFRSHWHTYVGVPEPNEVVVDRVTVWPELIVRGLADTKGGVSVGLIVTENAADVTSSAGEPVSVTLSSNDHEPTVDRLPVEAVGLSPTMHENEAPRLL